MSTTISRPVRILGASIAALVVILALDAGLTMLAPVRAMSEDTNLPPALVGPVNDFASVIDADTEAEIGRTIRRVNQRNGAAIVAATVQSIRPYTSILLYAAKMFENRGRGIGQRGRNNGVLVVIALDERLLRIEVGYGLETVLTDSLTASIVREMTPLFARRDYGDGLQLGINRIADALTGNQRNRQP